MLSLLLLVSVKQSAVENIYYLHRTASLEFLESKITWVQPQQLTLGRCRILHFEGHDPLSTTPSSTKYGVMRAMPVGCNSSSSFA